MATKYTDNYIDLSNLPRHSRGIDWMHIQDIPVRFKYRGVEDVLVIKRYVNSRYEIVEYNGQEYQISVECLKSCGLGKLFGFANPDNFRYKVGDIIEHDSKASIKVLNLTRTKTKYSKRGAKAYEVECLKCHNSFTIKESNIVKGDRCPYCSNHKILPGFNDIATTNPELIKYFANPADATQYSAKSNKLVLAKCPNCDTIVGKRGIDWISRQGVSCPVCGAGRSFPNRVMYNLLSGLDVNFKTEVRFDWCVFPSYTDATQTTYGLFDFVLLDSKTIIEMDSGLGHGRKMYTCSSMSKEETVYRDSYKERLAVKHGYRVVRVNCEYYGVQAFNKFEYIKDGILSSEVSQMLNLSHVDWKHIQQLSESSQLKEICDAYNQGYSVKELADKYKFAICTIRDYLHKGTQCGLCEYGYKQKSK